MYFKYIIEILIVNILETRYFNTGHNWQVVKWDPIYWRQIQLMYDIDGVTLWHC